MQILNTLGLSSLICGMGILTFLSILREVTVQTAYILTTQRHYIVCFWIWRTITFKYLLQTYSTARLYSTSFFMFADLHLSIWSSIKSQEGRVDVWSYLFVTLRTSHFWLDSEVEALREDSLRLLAICSCRFSLASFILLAKSLAYSAASSLFFLVGCFFRAIRRRLCCRTHGVTRCWILGALVLGFLPSLFMGFRTTYWQISSLERLKNLRILLALFGPRLWGTEVSVTPGISFSPFFMMTKLKTLHTVCVCVCVWKHFGVHNATPYRFALSFSSPPSSVTGMSLTQ